MISTYVAALAVVIASLAIGQAAITLCGERRWSWLSPAVGLALVAAVCWGTVRLPGHGIVSAVAVLALALVAVFRLHGRVEGVGEALRSGLPVGLAALVAASLPFIVEGRFGIVGTGFNPDMSQHLLTAVRLAHGAASQLLGQGYPLGPHSIVVALDKGLGVGPVQGFSGLTVAAAVLAPLVALAAFRDLPPLPRTAAALLVGLPYMVASYLAQGAFKETMQALFVLAFVLSLREASLNPAWHKLPLRLVPAALIAIGTVYVYSFPGLVWLAATVGIWLALDVTLNRFSAGGVGVGMPSACAESAEGKASSPSSASSRCPEQIEAPGGQPNPTTGPAADNHGPETGPAGLPAWSLALIVFAVGALPELGRMIDFHSFETFAPHGPGLGNLFGQISPFEALGIWPSGDFRLAPGGGAAPAFAYYLGVAFALALLLWGLVRCLRDRELAVVAGLLTTAGVYAATRIGGTPYTAAKAIEVAAPLVTLAIALPLLGASGGRLSRGIREKGALTTPSTGRVTIYLLAAAVFAAAAGGCSLLALANAPVGPTSYTPALAELRPLANTAPTLILAPRELLADQHGTPYLAWELRGGRVCIEAEGEKRQPPPGVRFVIAEGSAARPPFPGLRPRRSIAPYVIWERGVPVHGPSPCPLIAVRQARKESGP